MVTKQLHQKDDGERGQGLRTFQFTVPRGALWYAGWILLNTAAIPAAGLAATPLAVLLTGLVGIGANAGLWPAAKTAALEMPGIVIGLALCIGAAQAVLLRNRLAQARLWFGVTAAGVLAGGLVVGVPVVRYAAAQNWDSFWIAVAVLLPAGQAVGLAQWLHLRRFAARPPGSFWSTSWPPVQFCWAAALSPA